MVRVSPDIARNAGKWRTNHAVMELEKWKWEYDMKKYGSVSP